MKSRLATLALPLSLLLLSGLASGSGNQSGCFLEKSRDLLGEPRSERPLPARPFDPSALLRSKGLDPSRLTFDFYRRNSHSPISTMIVSYEGRSIQRTHFMAEPVEKKAIPSTGELPERHPVHGSLRGRGIGTIGYLMAARALFQRHGLILRSDVISDEPGEGLVSESAVKLWSRLEGAGWAKPVPCIFGRCMEFRKDVLGSPAFRLVDEYCRTQCRFHDTGPPEPGNSGND